MKKLFAVLCAAMLCACALILAACGGGSAGQSGPSDEELIAQEMEKNIASFREGMASASDVFAEDESLMNLLELVGLDAKEFTDAITSKMDMETGAIQVNGDTATVEVVLTAPDFESINGVLETTVTDKISSLDTSQLTETDLYAEIGKAIMEAVNSDELQLKTETIDVEYAKSNGTWSIANPDELTQAMSAFYSYE